MGTMSSSLKYWISKYNLKPKGVIHAGAHLVQERNLYRELNLEPVLWIEAHPEIAIEAQKLLVGYPKQKLINAALWSQSGEEIKLSEAGNEGSSSSLLELGLITGSHPQVICTKQILVRTKTLEEILTQEDNFSKSIDFLCVDTQGAEAEVIKGLGNKILNFNYILAEVSIRRLYKSAALFSEVTELLSQLNFTLIGSNVNKNTGWGDAMYVRNSEISRIGILESDFEQILTTEGSGLATKVRYLLLKIGIPNNTVARISRRN